MLGFVLVLLPSALAADPVLTLPGSALVPGASTTVRLIPSVGKGGAVTPLFVDGCAPVELERLVEDRWVRVPPAPCTTTRNATRAEGPLSLDVTVPEPGRYRAVVSWGQGCTTGFPLELSGCTLWGGTEPLRFEVSPPPPPPAP